MTYYEELGLDASASLEQIREAYLYLARLLHPDQQQDEDLRRLAEAQMKRVNHIYEVLSDPDRRRRYDSELERQNAEPAVPRIVPAPKHARTRNFGTVVWLASALLGLAGIYWYVSREASVGTPFSAAPYITQAKEQAAHSAPAADPIVRPAAPEPRARAKEDTSRTAQLLAELIDLQLQLKGATAERDRALQQVARQKTEIEELNRRLGEEREKGRSDERSTVPAPAAPAMPVTAKSDQAVRGRFAG
jgi:curved DNA-binding protein CbpA